MLTYAVDNPDHVGRGRGYFTDSTRCSIRLRSHIETLFT